MQYRDFGDNIGWDPSALGFGAMRFPTEDGEVDEDRAIEMIRYAIDNGVNYVDTAWPYHDGESERVVGKALEDGYRNRVALATKMPSWELEERSDLDDYLAEQLNRLGVDCIDCYLLHALNSDHWETYRELEVFDWIERVKAEGKIEQVGFSFHDDPGVFKEIVDGYDWDFTQIQYNYLDEEYQAGREGLEYAAERGIGVIVMEPLRGGELATDLPDAVREVFDRAETDRDPVEWALEWLWNQPEVSLVLSGMSTLEQVEQNVALAEESAVGSLSADEVAIVDEAAATYRDLLAVDCTGCSYCMPCPTGVDIVGNFDRYNRAEVYDEYGESREWYDDLDDERRASACVDCGECEAACPQNLPISDLMDDVDAYFAGEDATA